VSLISYQAFILRCQPHCAQQNLQGIYLHRPFTKADSFFELVLRDVDFQGADLREANLKTVFIRNSNFQEANLENTILSGADLAWSDLDKVNLDWSRGPSLEWQIIGGKKGSPVSTGEWVILFNVRVGKKGGEPLIWFPNRVRAGHIGWPSSKDWFGQLKEFLGEEAEKAINEGLDKAKSEGWKMALTGGP
jgi:hypothetical protein